MAEINSFQSLKQQTDLLLSYEQYSSAEILISLFISQLSKNALSNKINKLFQSDLYELYGDVLYLKGDYHRSLHSYSTSMHFHKSIDTNKSNLSKTNKIVLISDHIDARIKHKEAKCHIKLNDISTAMSELEKIPISLRNVSINLSLGFIYKINGLNQQAISIYKEILKELPYCMEVIESLALLTTNKNDFISIYNNITDSEDINNISNNISINQTNSKSNINKNTKISLNFFLSNQMLIDYYLAFYYSKSYDYNFISNQFQVLLKYFPDNSYISQHAASSYMLCDKEIKSYNLFTSIRNTNPYSYDKMDLFGLLLYKRKEAIILNKLSFDLLKTNSNKPTAWIVASLYCDLKGYSEKSMGYIDKAISIDSKYSFSFIIKGMYLLSQGQAKQATVCYFQANLLNKDVLSLSGLIDCHLTLNRHNDAFNLAKEAVILYKKSPRSYYLLGNVLAQSKTNVNESLKSYMKALKLDPSNEEVAVKLVEILTNQKRYDEAIEIIKSVLQTNDIAKEQSILLRINLSNILSSIGNYTEAIQELHLCSSLCSVNGEDHTVVAKELEKLESLIRGNSAEESQNFMQANDEDDNNDNDVTHFDEEANISRINHSARYSNSYTRSRIDNSGRYSRRSTRDTSSFRSLNLFDDDDEDGGSRPVDRELFAD